MEEEEEEKKKDKAYVDEHPISISLPYIPHC